jgi:hypothetical protein
LSVARQQIENLIKQNIPLAPTVDIDSVDHIGARTSDVQVPTPSASEGATMPRTTENIVDVSPGHHRTSLGFQDGVSVPHVMRRVLTFLLIVGLLIPILEVACNTRLKALLTLSGLEL